MTTVAQGVPQGSVFSFFRITSPFSHVIMLELNANFYCSVTEDSFALAWTLPHPR